MTVHDTGLFSEGHNRADAVLSGRDNTDDEITRAARYVASHAHNAADCRDLLEALGILDPGYRWIDKGHGRRERVNR